MVRYAISYEVCTACIDEDAQCDLRTDHFHREVPKILKRLKFDVKLKRTMYTHKPSEGFDMSNVMDAAKQIHDLDPECEYIRHIIVSTIDGDYDLLSKFCNCSESSASEN